VLLVAGWHVVGDEGDVDISLSNEKSLHSFFSIVASGPILTFASRFGRHFCEC
jgi:hypothetical protein